MGLRPFPSFFAQSPTDFSGAGNVRCIPYQAFIQLLPEPNRATVQGYGTTAYGTRTQLPLIPSARLLPSSAMISAWGINSAGCYLALLGCVLSDAPGELLCRVCFAYSSLSNIVVLQSCPVSIYLETTATVIARGQLFSLPSDAVARFQSDLVTSVVYLGHPARELIGATYNEGYIPPPLRGSSLPSATLI